MLRITRLHRRVTIVAVVAAASLVAVAPAPARGSVPPEFDKSVIASGLDMPTAFRFASGGRVFIAEQKGTIRLVTNGVLRAAPVVTLPTASTDERGLLGIELDPNFDANGYLYAAYTHAENLNRLSRFTVVGNSISLASETILLKSNQ